MPSQDDDRDYDDRPKRREFTCPYCKTHEMPLTKSQISVGGWIVFAVLIAVCLPLCWIGLFIKEEYQQCYDCGMKLN